MPGRLALFVFAHQDDEVIASTRITRELQGGNRVRCVYLTDGAGRGVDPAVRDAESLAVLADLGVGRADVVMGERVPDGDLPLHLDTALGIVEAAAAGEPDRVYSLAFEGGHQDHDASHLVALAYACRHGLLRRTWQLPFYTGSGAPGKLFRVMRPVPGLPACARRLPRDQALRSARLATRYPSQKRTWIGLAPEYLLRRGLQRREILQPVTVPPRPIAGTPLYDALFGYPQARFDQAAAPFLGRLLGEDEVADEE